ncbi:MAG: class I SAM-dependent DNA methyltransferase [Rhodothermaceae bacterium]|nr:class I SAM-dependent DNA methyltransferase [Rhodothermaceae bacterium]
MRLSWNEIRARAAKFADLWQAAAYEKGETQSFYNDFFEVFGVQRRTVARYEQHVAKLGNRSGYIDLFWPGVLIVEQKSAGRNLEAAKEQAGEYFDALSENERPRYILVSDFQVFNLYDLDEREGVHFHLAELPSHVEAFGFIIGQQRRVFRDQDPVNIRASELVGRLHDMLDEAGYRGHDLERFLVRVVFCLFADDTGIFEPRDIFFEFIAERTGEDGADLGPWLTQLFQVLDTPEYERTAALDEDLNRFPYVNGALFEGMLRIPSFNAAMRQALLEACLFDWSNISPAIFGALFQSVMNPQQRRRQGVHYTTEKNILKVIEPLFLDDLRNEFKQLKSRKDTRRGADLRRFLEKLAQMRFLDPACGCGNFLIIAYRELRLLELDVLKEIYSDYLANRQIELSASDLSLINVDQFYGIEISEFPVRIAETAMWMMDHIMNNRLSLVFGQTYARIPLEASPRIVHGDALELDWAALLPPGDCSFLFGNPPFGGAKFQSNVQRAQVRRIADLGGTGGTLDYVAAWFIRAGEYIAPGSRIGFVATNSITQGEQAAQLWPILFSRCRLGIAFAHRTFAWGSDARGKAHVHVVIIGLDDRDAVPERKRLFSYPNINGDPEDTLHSVLSPYLFDAGGLGDPNLTVREESSPINGMKKLITGTQPLEKGNLTFSNRAKSSFLVREPDAEPYFRPFPGSREFIRGHDRWILHTADIPPQELRDLPMVRDRLRAVQAFRAKSKRIATRRLADFPRSYGVTVVPEAPFLIIPQVSSERREYVPIGWLEPPVIPSEKLRLLPNATLSEFAILTSAMHMAWMRTVTGRLESRYMYSVGVVYNTFPTPPADANLSKLTPLAQAILDARATYPEATLADLYDPDLMPPSLLRAHKNLDRAVDRLYSRRGFRSESERVKHLFMRYERMQAPLTAKMHEKRRRR